MDRIGEGLVARPGHMMPSIQRGTGISISDDNLAVSSALINEKVSTPANRAIAEAFDGVAINSCGKWTHTMSILRDCPDVLMIDCAVSPGRDPAPNLPEEVGEILDGSGIIVKARFSDDIDGVLSALENLAGPGMKLVVEVPYCSETAEASHKRVTEKLSDLYVGLWQRVCAPGAAGAPRTRSEEA